MMTLLYFYFLLVLFLFFQDKEKKKKESILDLSKYIDKTIRVKFQGGREGELQTEYVIFPCILTLKDFFLKYFSVFIYYGL